MAGRVGGHGGLITLSNFVANARTEKWPPSSHVGDVEEPSVTNHLDGGNRWPHVIEAVSGCDDQDLRRIVAAAKPHALRICLYQLTHDERYRIIEVSNSVKGAGGVSAGPIPVVVRPEDVEWLREQAVALLTSYRSGRVEAPVPTRLQLQGLLETLFGLDIPAWEMDLWWEEFAAVEHPRGCSWFGSLSREQAARFNVLVIGAGMGGGTPTSTRAPGWT
jgi:hypothetical protein